MDSLHVAWEPLAAAAQTFLTRRQGSEVWRRLPGIHLGFRKTAFCPRAGREGEALTVALAQQLQAVRQAEAALRLWPVIAATPPAAALLRWRSARAEAAQMQQCPLNDVPDTYSPYEGGS